jgi:hypothetical protein
MSTEYQNIRTSQTASSEPIQSLASSSRPLRGAAVGILIGLALGSAAMYLLDPRQGTRRRAITQDKLRSLASRSSIRAGKTYRHLRNKLEGGISQLAGAFLTHSAVSDRKLADRIRSTIGRTISHPHAVDFAVHGGRVTVRGNLRPHEAGQVIQAVERVAGVVAVDNQIIDTSITTSPLQ